MRKEVILKHLGYVLFINAIFLFISFIISLSLKESSTVPLLYSSLICFIFGILPLIFVPQIEVVEFTEGLAIVVYGWLITCITGMLPYVMWGGEFSLINAWFESVSGFTTTGSTILNDIEILPKGLLFWRSSTHWIGGIGVILFVMLFLFQSRSKRTTIYNSEISALSKINFKRDAKGIVKILALVYLGLTFTETLLLTIVGMDFFDAVNHSFATIATGGFSTKNLSIAYYDNVWIEIIIMFFMVLSGIHFGLIYGTILFKKKQLLFKSSLAKWYLIVLLIGIVFVVAKLYFSDYFDSFGKALRYGAFQVISLGTTTGFATTDTAAWPIFTKIILIYFTIQCAMSGSTSGGLKFDRVYLFFKSLGNQLKQLKHPHGVFITTIDGKIIPDQLQQQTLVFIVLYILTFLATTIILTAMDIDGMTAFSASIATLGNVGPGFANVSSLGNFSGLPDLAKFVLTINMLLGRLELFNVFAFFMIKK